VQAGLAWRSPYQRPCVRALVKSQLYDVAGYDLTVVAGAVLASAIATGMAALFLRKRRLRPIL